MQLAGRMFKQWERMLAVVCLCGVFMAGPMTSNAASDSSQSIGRSRVYKFRHITSAQAQEYLSQLKIGSGYNALTADVLIVTSVSSTDLIKATEAISVLDQEKPTKISVLLVETEDQTLPDPEALSAGLSTITAGTLTDAPPKGAGRPAIVDIVDNKLIGIGTEDVVADLEKAIEIWKKTRAKAEEAEAKAVEPNVPAKPLAEVASELFAMQSKTQIAEPNTTELMDEALKSEAETEEDFLAIEMLRALAQAEEEKEQAAMDAEAEEAKPEVEAGEPAAETEAGTPAVEEDDPLARIRALLMQSAAEEKAAEEEAARLQAAQAEAEAGQPGVPSKLQSDIEKTRQRLAELEAIAAGTEQAEATAEETTTVQTAPKIDPDIGDKEMDTIIDLPQEVMLESLVELVGKQLELNYMYDPQILKNQKVTLKIHNGKIKVKDTYALLESVLRFRGFVMSRRGNLVTIVKAADAAQAVKQMDVSIRYPDDPIPPGDIIVGTIFELENIGTDSAKDMLTKMGLGLGATAFQEVPETGTLIVTDYAYRMEQIANVLSMVDVPGDPKEFKYRQLKYMTPGELVPKLTDLAEQMEGVSLQVSSSPAATPTPATRTVTTRNPQTGRTETKRVPISSSTPSASAAAKPAQKNTVFIDTDDRTNRILMVGTPGQIALVNELVDTLDVPQADLKFVKEYVIQYVEAIEVVDVLNELELATVSVAAQTSTAAQGRTTTPPRPTTAGRTPATRTTTPPRTTSQPSGAAAAANQPSISIRPATNSLLVNASQEQHEAIELVIAHVDVVQKDQRTIREYEIQNVDTQEILDTMVDLGLISDSQASSNSSSRSNSTRTSSRSTTTRGATTPPAAGGEDNTPAPTALLGVGGDEKSLSAEEPQISILEATNSMLVYATPRQHDAIALLIAHADRIPVKTTTPYVIYALENQDPIELAEVLNKLIQETIEETKTASAAGGATGAKIQTKAASGSGSMIPTLEEEAIRIIPDAMSYSLIVYANKRNQQWVSELIQELDEYRPQVLLDCTLVEIIKDDEFNYSIDLITKTYGGSTIQAGSPVESTAVYGPFSPTSLADASSIGGSVTGFFNSEMIQGVLEAVQKNKYGRIMAQPKILVNDNQNGVITTKTTTSVAQVSSQTTTTDGVTNTSENVTFDPYEKGVTLDILPHISKGDMLRLEITLNRTDFEEKGTFPYKGDDYQIPPDLLSTDVQTIATVPDGTTIILGGLESVAQSKGQSKVPILGDLPLIGTLFRGVENKDGEDRLYVFVKASIIRPGDQVEGLEDIRRVSGKYRQEFEEMEAKFQGLKDFPGIKPPPMNPKRVLEDDFEEETELIEK